MKAIIFSEHGTLQNITYTDIAKPEIGPNDVLIRVGAAALNRLCLWVLEGWPGLNLKLPHIMGSDGAGTIAEIGSNVSGWEIGDRVAVDPSVTCGTCRYCATGRGNMCNSLKILGEHLPGFSAEFASVPARNLVKMPDHVSFADAAAASLVYVTAWHSLIKKGNLRAGEDVLIVGAGGGVNTASIQIARLAGARHIYVVGSSDEKLAQAKLLGADVLINRNKEDWGKAIFKATNREGVDIVVDNVGAATYRPSMRSLKKGGRLLTVGNTSGPKFEIDNRLIFGKQISLIGSTMGTHQDYVEVMQLVFAGKLKPVIDTIYPLAEGKTAYERLEVGDVVGKLLIDPTK